MIGHETGCVWGFTVSRSVVATLFPLENGSDHPHSQRGGRGFVSLLRHHRFSPQGSSQGTRSCRGCGPDRFLLDNVPILSGQSRAASPYPGSNGRGASPSERSRRGRSLFRHPPGALLRFRHSVMRASTPLLARGGRGAIRPDSAAVILVTAGLSFSIQGSKQSHALQPCENSRTTDTAAARASPGSLLQDPASGCSFMIGTEPGGGELGRSTGRRPCRTTAPLFPPIGRPRSTFPTSSSRPSSPRRPAGPTCAPKRMPRRPGPTGGILHELESARAPTTEAAFTPIRSRAGRILRDPPSRAGAEGNAARTAAALSRRR